jgi:hypothetical protein
MNYKFFRRYILYTMDLVELLIQKLFLFNKFLSKSINIYTYNLNDRKTSWGKYLHGGYHNIKTFTCMRPVYRFTGKKNLLKMLLGKK